MASAHAISSEIQLDKGRLRKHYLTLTECQRNFVKHVVFWIKKPRKMLIVVSGGPGTGKSYVVKNTLDCIKNEQLRMSFTARSAVAIGGRTIHSTLGLSTDGLLTKLETELAEETNLLTCIKKSRSIVKELKCRENPYIIVFEESSMINGWFMYWLIDFFIKRTDLPILIVCMGDPHQLTPIKSVYNLFSIKFSKTKTKFEIYKINLTENKRFDPEYEKLINVLRKFVDENDEKSLLDFVNENFPVVEEINNPLLMTADRAMASKRESVKTYNKFYLKHKVVGPEIEIDENVIFKPDCLVFVTKNYCSEVNNGTLLIFLNYDSGEDVAICKYPNFDSEVKVHRDPFTGKFPLELGFAGTIHKYQGDTIDDLKIVINFNKSTNPNLIYTALSRVRNMKQILGIEL